MGAQNPHRQGSELAFSAVAGWALVSWLIFAALPRGAALIFPDLQIAVLRDLSAVVALSFALAALRAVPRGSSRWAVWSVGFWLAWALVAAATAPSIPRGLASLRWYVLYPAFYTLGVWAVRYPRKSRIVLVAGGAVVLLNASLALLQWITNYAVDVHTGDDITVLNTMRFGARGAIGALESRPALGILMALAISQLVARNLGGVQSTWGRVSLAALFISAGVFSLSRTAWAAIIVAVGVGAVGVLMDSRYRQSMRRWMVVIAFVVPVLAIIPLLSSDETVAIAFSEGTRDADFSGRTGLWKDEVLARVTKDPAQLLVGYGLGTVGGESFFGDASVSLVPVTDNSYLHILVEVGLIGLVLALALISRFVLNFRQRRSVAKIGAATTLLLAAGFVDVMTVPVLVGSAMFLVGYGTAVYAPTHTSRGFDFGGARL